MSGVSFFPIIEALKSFRTYWTGFLAVSVITVVGWLSMGLFKQDVSSDPSLLQNMSIFLTESLPDVNDLQSNNSYRGY